MADTSDLAAIESQSAELVRADQATIAVLVAIARRLERIATSLERTEQWQRAASGHS